MSQDLLNVETIFAHAIAIDSARGGFFAEGCWDPVRYGWRSVVRKVGKDNGQ
jgi:hypothetical protein